jgi:hypothetical protein
MEADSEPYSQILGEKACQGRTLYFANVYGGKVTPDVDKNGHSRGRLGGQN